jgi:periplasmic protein TonB
MKKILVLLFLLFSVQTFAQKTKAKHTKKIVKKKVVEVEEDIIFTKVEEPKAEFVGGDSAWNAFLQKNLQADVATKNGAPAGKYTAVIKFIVRKDGSLSDFKIETNPGYGTAEEAIRLLKTSPNWNPYITGGLKVSFYVSQPITFVVL